ncbi:MAG: DUF1330 domain-containing protein [Myxococcota bacterium]
MPTASPRPDQIEALAQDASEGRIHMLNLLKFKERAEYADGRETSLSGAEAYGLYGAGLQPIFARIGARIVWAAPAKRQVIGDGDLPWDAVAVVEYPSKSAFLEMVASEDYQACAVHRDAGLAHQVLVQCSPEA